LDTVHWPEPLWPEPLGSVEPHLKNTGLWPLILSKSDQSSFQIDRKSDRKSRINDGMKFQTTSEIQSSQKV